jgi:hypothetical protein
MRRKTVRLSSHLHTLILALALSFAAAISAAPVSDLFGPVLGFVFEPRTGSLRPISGIPGAAKVGQPLSILHHVDNAVISPGQNYALIWRGNVPGLKLVRFDSPAEEPYELNIDDAVTRVDFSRSGTAAAIWEADGVQVITGLPESPISASKMQLQWGRMDPVASAVRNDGSAILAGFSDGAVGALALWSNDSGIRLIAAPAYPAAIVFDSSGKDALVADAVSNQVILIKDAEGAAATVLVAGEDQGIRSPQSVAFDDSNELAISLDRDGKILVASLSQNWSRLVVPPVRPSGLNRLKGSSAFRLTDDIFRPIWCIAIAKDQDRMFFIPAAQLPAKRRPQEWAR